MKQARLNKKMKINGAALILGISRTYLRMIEANQVKPDAELYRKMVGLYGKRQ